MSTSTSSNHDKRNHVLSTWAPLAGCLVPAIILIVVVGKLHDRNAQAADLQAQLEKGESRIVALQAEVDKAKAQASDLDNQLHQATAGSTQLLTQLDQAKIHSLDLESRLDKAESDIAQLQLLLLKARHMPITTSFETVHNGSSFTLHISNLYLQPLSVNLNIMDSNKARTRSDIIGSGRTLSVDKLKSDDCVVFASEGYDSVTVTPQ